MNKTALWIGSFIVGGLLLAAGAVIWLSGSSLFDSQIRAVLYFEQGVAGLYKGAPVTYRGVVVGEVESIGLDVNQQTLKVRIPVKIRLSEDAVTFSGGSASGPVMQSVSDLVQRGLRAKLFAQSIVTGQKSIELDTVADAPPVSIAAGPLPEIPVVADKFDAIVDQLSELPLRDVVKELRDTLGVARETLAVAKVTVAAAGQALGVVGTQAGQTLKVANGAIVQVQADAKGALDSVTRLADTAQGTVLAAQPELMRTLGAANRAAESAQLAMARVADLAAPDAPLRADLETAVADLGQAARGLRDWSELLQEQPNAIVFGRKRAAKGPP